MKCYGVVLLSFGLISHAMNQVPITTEADLRKAYEKVAMQNWQPTTIAYMEKYPESSESYILKRYLQSFVNRAMQNKFPPSAQIVGAEIYHARSFTPSTPEEYKYIIKGKQFGGIAAVLVCTHNWNEKFKEIEEDIKKKSKK